MGDAPSRISFTPVPSLHHGSLAGARETRRGLCRVHVAHRSPARQQACRLFIRTDSWRGPGDGGVQPRSTLGSAVFTSRVSSSRVGTRRAKHCGRGTCLTASQVFISAHLLRMVRTVQVQHLSGGRLPIVRFGSTETCLQVRLLRIF